MEIEVDISGVLKGLDMKSKGMRQGAKNGIEKAALYLEAKMVEKINSNIAPPLKPETIKRKGSSLALVDTSGLFGQITSKVSGGEAKIGVIGSRAEIASYHEFGVPYNSEIKIIPERSFVRSTYNAEKNKVKGIIKDEIEKAIQT